MGRICETLQQEKKFKIVVFGFFQKEIALSTDSVECERFKMK